MPLRAVDLMKADPITVAPEMPVLDVQHLFVQANIGGAPVVDSSGVVRGVVTSTDLLRVMDQACDDDIDPPESDEVEGLTAIDVATPSPIWVTPDAPLSEVARVMRHEGIHRVLVGSDGRLAGVLSAFDLLEVVR
jgi:CBS domain-containing protein